jgi:hypothetical protein
MATLEEKLELLEFYIQRNRRTAKILREPKVVEAHLREADVLEKIKRDLEKLNGAKAMVESMALGLVNKNTQCRQTREPTETKPALKTREAKRA